MKTLQSLTNQLAQWRQTYKPLRSLLPSRFFDSPAAIPAQGLGLGLSATLQNRRNRPRIVWVLAVVSLTGTMGERYYNAPKLAVGKIAPQTIRAPFDANVVDTLTTEEKRKAARTGAVPVLTIQQDVTEQVYEDLERSLRIAEDLRQRAGSFPIVSTTVLSPATQIDLRKCAEWEWRSILAAVDTDIQVNQSPSGSFPNANGQSNSSATPAVAELQAYYQVASPQEFSALIDTINKAREQYAKAAAAFLDSNPERRYDASLLDLSNETWEQTKTGIPQVAERMLTQGIPPGLPDSILQEALRVQMNLLVPPEAEPVATQLLLWGLRPNLTEDQEQTKQLAEQAAKAVELQIIPVRKDEVIVRGGATISQEDFVLLEYFQLSRRSLSWSGLLGFGILVTGAVATFWRVERRFHPQIRQRDHLLILLLTLSTPVLVSLGVRYTNLPAVGLLVGSFHGSALGVTVVGLLSGVLSISLPIAWDYLLAGAAGGIMMSVLAGKMRSREELAFLGVGVGLTQGTVYLIVHLILSTATGSIWYTVLQEAALCGFSGLAWSIVALGLSPYLEHVFDLVTPIRLAELANPNRPLLKRLAAQAPGTFQHTLFVSTLAEAAARELGCNVELVRAGTLYHDIGKMHDPLGFIENQMGGPNKHDEINDPWKSAEIIKKHVTEGMVMARRCRLPKAIQGFIPEHQGTMLIAYFYHQAQQIAEKDPTKIVREEDFRYDGPIPQSRETGVMMLADSCEAALRSLKDATPEQALSMINKILRARWQDSQLAESGLTREELSRIAEVFVQVWQQYNHQRIAYPKFTVNAEKGCKASV
ncbi:HD family phosphohydrolase [Coleofasciculus sp. FACHB-1120]|uniref:HD family phosphohydrolase n=1 Tax=Coleofasciculus sp. FACHB-1120 TaxID=2692783 RepID=UPI001685439D|nr:HD family phosphohydrolase [Coleofasciculus sp. FACHB-1120]MBD2741126.1 HD family phosphohydrolase [Coleofasciculus sp. FACHB-1120]